jgi:hypothetical protein
MLKHKEKFADPLMRKAAAVRCGLPFDSDAAKVRQGGSGSGVRELPPQVTAELDQMWERLVAPVTGTPDYESLIATLPHG